MTIDFGLARAVDAESSGDPGQRTFRLRVAGDNGEIASLWMEKQQFIAIGLAMGQALSQLRHATPEQQAAPFAFPATADHEFKVGRMAVGLDPADRTIALFTYDIADEDEDSQPTLRFRLSPDQSEALRRRLEEVIAQGRPLCPLCQLPLDPDGHSCIRSNGHSQQPIPEERDDGSTGG
jgi:uncharacterized repeat protein (TIGR03847 family)